MRAKRDLTIALLAAASMAPAGVAQQRPKVAPRPPMTEVMAAKDSTYLGIGVKDVDSDRAKALKMKEERGAEVTSVEDDSPASKAGIRPGDVILDYNGTAVEGMEQLQRLVRETPPGRAVKLNIWRNGAPQTLTATVGQRKGTWIETGDGNMQLIPNMAPMPVMPAMPAMPRMITIMPSGRLGIEGEALGEEPQFADFMGVKDGVLVKAVDRNSAAERAGMRAGDVIVKVEDTHVSSSGDITSALRANRSKKSLSVTIVRAKKEIPITVTWEEHQ